MRIYLLLDFKSNSNAMFLQVGSCCLIRNFATSSINSDLSEWASNLRKTSRTTLCLAPEVISSTEGTSQVSPLFSRQLIRFGRLRHLLGEVRNHSNTAFLNISSSSCSLVPAELDLLPGVNLSRMASTSVTEIPADEKRAINKLSRWFRLSFSKLNGNKWK